MNEKFIHACALALEYSTVPYAFKGPGGEYLYCNQAFSELLGYNCEELCKMRFDDVTWLEDIGGERASFEAIVSGSTRSSSQLKRYRHRTGKPIYCNVSMHRFPESHREPLGCIIVEALPELCTLQDLREVNAKVTRELDSLRGMVMAKNTEKEHDVQHINIGNTTNSQKAVIALTVAVMFLGGVVIWLAYYVFAHGTVPPPSIPLGQ